MSLVLDHVGKVYDKRVLDGICLEMKRGVYGLLGPNGAGKSTLIRLICGIEAQTEGSILYEGKMITESKILEDLGYVPQKAGFYEGFTAQEFLEYMAVMKGLPDGEIKNQIEKALEIVDLKEVREEKIKTFSGGMKQRVSIAQAVLNEPKVLILDEPTVGLDIKERMKFKQFISEISGDRIVIYATHIVSDIEDIGSRIVFMGKGRNLAVGTPELLLESLKNKVWEIRCSKEELPSLKKKGKISNIRNQEETVILRLVAEEKPCDHAENASGNLQDLYLYLFDEISG